MPGRLLKDPEPESTEENEVTRMSIEDYYSEHGNLSDDALVELFEDNAGQLFLDLNGDALICNVENADGTFADNAASLYTDLGDWGGFTVLVGDEADGIIGQCVRIATYRRDRGVETDEEPGIAGRLFLGAEGEVANA